MLRPLLLLPLALLAVPVSTAQQPPVENIAGLGPLAPAKKLHTGFKFTEGPAADAEGNVFFSDIPASRIHKVDLKGNLSTFREKSNRANGLMFNAKGELVACEMAGQ